LIIIIIIIIIIFEIVGKFLVFSVNLNIYLFFGKKNLISQNEKKKPCSQYSTWFHCLIRIEQPMSNDFKMEFAFSFFCRRAHCLWCPKTRWSPPLGATIALKIGKNELEARKLWSPSFPPT
jgi:hypothetical protein